MELPDIASSLDALPVSAITLLLGSLAALAILVVRYAFTKGHRSRDMPSGPPTLPFIGNLHQIPAAYTHIQFTEWARKYGGLYMLKLGNANMAVITDRRLVKEVVDKKSGIYSHRPHSFVSHELITKGNHLLVMHYGAQWRTFRRLIHQHLMEPMVDSDHLKIVNAEAVQLTRDFLRDPANHMLHPKRFSNSISNSIVFGIRSASVHGTYMKRLYTLMENWSVIMETGNTPPVDIFPWLKAIPETLFQNYKSRAGEIGQQMITLYADIVNEVIARREKGVQLGSFMDYVLDNQEKNALPWEQLCFIGGVLMEGGSDTSSSLILAIVQALIHFPEVQEKAFAEIDAVVGRDRTPCWDDMDRLPYINKIVKEGHRWRPILPLCFPHALGQDDWVDGKFLPKGTIVVINTWGIHMDPSHPNNAEPEKFIPERFDEHTKLAPEYAVGKWEARDHYGYGVARRICPGIHLAERNMLVSIAKLIWAMRFEKGEGVNDSDPVSGYHQGFLYCAKEYSCKVTPRGDYVNKVLDKEYEQAKQDVFSRYREG